MALTCDAIQIFNQSPRAWRPTRYGPDDFAEFREAMASSRISSAVIHAIYLINPATDDPELRRKSLASLIHALEVGEAIGADGVIIHPGARKGDTRERAKDRAVAFLSEALAETGTCPLLFENTAGSEALLGTGLPELGELLERCGGGERLGLCIDSCHLHASGHDVRTEAGAAAILDELEAEAGLERLAYVHLNDSRDERGSNRDRHAAIGKGEIGRAGFRAFLSEPRLEGLPAVSETPGPEGKGPDKAEVALMRRLRREGTRSRAGRAG